MFSLLPDYKKIKGLTEEWFRVLLLLILTGTTLLFLAGLLMRTCDGITIQKMGHFCLHMLYRETNVCEGQYFHNFVKNPSEKWLQILNFLTPVSGGDSNPCSL